MLKINNMSNNLTKKRPPNAYNLFCQDETLRNEIKQNNPDWSSGEIMKELAKRWKDLSETDKKPFEESAQKGKELFLETKLNDDDMIKVLKRPKSSYMHFSNNKEVRDKIKGEHPDWKVTQIASHLGSLWNNMDKKEKKVWEDVALAEKNSLLEEPVYVYKKKKSTNKQTPLENRIDHLEKVVMELQHTIQQLINENGSQETVVDKND